MMTKMKTKMMSLMTMMVSVYLLLSCHSLWWDMPFRYIIVKKIGTRVKNSCGTYIHSTPRHIPSLSYSKLMLLMLLNAIALLL
jgi:hypothetical protein